MCVFVCVCVLTSLCECERACQCTNVFISHPLRKGKM